MTPPEAPSMDALPAVSLCLKILKKRPDFLAAARARKQASESLILQARNRKDGTETIRVGFTCSKKVGNAVARNRAKRRLRETARAVLPFKGQPGWDYVLIGRAGVTAARPFDLLKADLESALTKIHANRPARPRKQPDT